MRRTIIVALSSIVFSHLLVKLARMGLLINAGGHCTQFFMEGL